MPVINRELVSGGVVQEMSPQSDNNVQVGCSQDSLNVPAECLFSVEFVSRTDIFPGHDQQTGMNVNTTLERIET